MQDLEIVATTDKELELVDALCIQNKQPILSVIVVHDDGRVSNAFWLAVKRYNLRLAGEADGDLIRRLRTEAFSYWGDKPN